MKKTSLNFVIVAFTLLIFGCDMPKPAMSFDESNPVAPTLVDDLVAAKSSYQDRALSSNIVHAKIASYTVMNGSPEDIGANFLILSASYTGGMNGIHPTNVGVFVNGLQLGTTASNIYTMAVYYMIPVRASVTFDLYADIGQVPFLSTMTTSLSVSGVGVTTGKSYSSNMAVGQTITIFK